MDGDGVGNLDGRRDGSDGTLATGAGVGAGEGRVVGSTVGKVIGDFDGFFVGEVDGEEVDMVFSEGVVDGCTVVVKEGAVDGGEKHSSAVTLKQVVLVLVLSLSHSKFVPEGHGVLTVQLVEASL